MTFAAPSEVHLGRKRRLATEVQTNGTSTGWGMLGTAHSSVPQPALESDGTFHQVGYISLRFVIIC